MTFENLWYEQAEPPPLSIRLAFVKRAERVPVDKWCGGRPTRRIARRAKCDCI